MARKAKNTKTTEVVARIKKREHLASKFLDNLAKRGKQYVRTQAPDQAGLFVRLGSIKDGKIGSHALVCGFQHGKKATVAKVSDVVSGERTLADIEATCRRWRENGKPDSVTTPTITKSKSKTAGGEMTLQECFDLWADLPAANRKRDKSVETVEENRRRWAAQTPDDWKPLAISEITTTMLVDHFHDLRLCRHVSPVSGKVVGETAKYPGIIAHDWLCMMQAVISAGFYKHELPNVADAALANPHVTRPDGDGKRPLTPQEIKAVLDVRFEDCRFDSGTKTAGKPDAYLWLRVLALKVGLLTGLRIGGLAKLKTAEINGVEIVRKKADKTFNKHTLPIPPQLREVLDEARLVKSGKHPGCEGRNWKAIAESPLLFPNQRGGEYGRKNDLAEAALKLLRKRFELPMIPTGDDDTLTHFTVHCFRYTIEQYADLLGIDANPILNHSKGRQMKDEYLKNPTDDIKKKRLARLTRDHQDIIEEMIKAAESA